MTALLLLDPSSGQEYGPSPSLDVTSCTRRCQGATAPCRRTCSWAPVLHSSGWDRPTHSAP